jgi:hypothetical protein
MNELLAPIFGVLLWNPMLALTPLIAGFLAPGIMMGRYMALRAICVLALALAAICIGSSAVEAHFLAKTPGVFSSELFLGLIAAGVLLAIGMVWRVFGTKPIPVLAAD